jgi:hypothetical protein
MRPQYLRLLLPILILILSTAAILSGCPPPGPPDPPETPHAETTISEAGGELVLGEAVLAIAGGALPSPMLVELTQDPNGDGVELDENETPVSDVFILDHDQDVVIDSAGAPFRLTLPFDDTAVAKDGDMDAKVYVKMDTEADIFTIIGTVTGPKIEIELVGLPCDATFQVVYNPNGEFLDGDAPAAKLLTAEPPWPVTQWRLHLDATNSVLRAAVAAALGISESSVTTQHVRQVLAERVRDNANEISTLFQAMGLRAPNNTVYTRPDGQKRFMLNVTNIRNCFENPTHESGVGQIHISCPTIGWAPSYRLGTVRGVIAHEAFHASVNGYNLKMGATSLKKKAFAGYNEGMATVIGHTVDRDNVISVRENAEGRDYALKLNRPLGIHDPPSAGYSNNDFFAYVGKRYGGGSMDYVVGTGNDGPDFKTGVLDQMRKYLTADTLLLPWASPLESYLIAYRMGLHNAMFHEFNESLADVYWDFACNRACENNEQSQLRTDDPGLRHELRRERFAPGGILERTFTSDTQVIPLMQQPELTDIPPLATRAIVLKGNNFNAKLTMAFDVSSWQPDPLGNAVKVKTYRTYFNGFELPENGEAEFNGFGNGPFDEVIALVSNLSLTASYTVDLVAETEPIIDPGECLPDQPTDRWRIQYYDGFTITDEYNLWHLETGGRVRDHATGVIPGYSWTFAGGKVIIWFGNEDNPMDRMEGQMLSHCGTIGDGRTHIGGFVTRRNWVAVRY